MLTLDNGMGIGGSLEFTLGESMEYDTFMSDRSPMMKLRSLENGDVLDVWEASWDGNVLQLTLSDEQTGFSPGALAEIESESAFYFGEVRQCHGSAMRVLVEHSLDRARLASLQDSWR
jgi:hypothetical protein